MRPNPENGFTLIEVMIALFIFALLAGMTSGVLYQSIKTREHLNHVAAELSDIQMTVQFLTQDITQMINRPVRVGATRLPALIGDAGRLEFTRNGFINPNDHEKRSTLIRIAYRCDHQKLIRDIYTPLDGPHRDHESMVLLPSVQNCQFAYLNGSLTLTHTWDSTPPLSDSEDNAFPKAIQWTVDINGWGTMTLLFPVWLNE